MDNDLNFLLNKDAKETFNGGQDENSLSFGSENVSEGNDWNGNDAGNDNGGEDNWENENDNESNEEDISVFSEDDKSQNQQPNLFMNPNSQSKPTQQNHQQFNPQQTREQIEQEKQEILYQIERMKKRGIQFPRSFTMASNLQDMKSELQRIKKDLEVDASINFQRKTLVTTISAAEHMNGRFNPLNFRLEGWSEAVQDSINDYDEVFEKLHEKYKSKSQMPPEVTILMMIASSGFMTHMTNTLFKRGGDSMTVESLLKNNPDLQKQMASATVDHLQKQQSQEGGGGDDGGILNMFKNMYQSPSPTQSPPKPQVQPKMKGPDTSDIDNILEELQLKPSKEDNDRFETMSALSDKKSQISLMSSLLSTNKKGKKQLNI